MACGEFVAQHRGNGFEWGMQRAAQGFLASVFLSALSAVVVSASHAPVLEGWSRLQVLDLAVGFIGTSVVGPFVGGPIIGQLVGMRSLEAPKRFSSLHLDQE